ARDPQHRSPSVRAIQAIAWGAGLIDPLPAVIVSRVTGDPPMTELTRSVADMSRDTAFSVVGVGRAPVADGGSIVVVALADRRVTFSSPLARRVSAGSRVRLDGRVADGLRNPEAAITHPDGRSEHFPLGDGPEFQSQFPVPTRGTYQIEIIADAAGGSTVLANFPVYVDTDPPETSEDVQSSHTEDVATVESTLLQLVNETRRAAGRTPLALMPELTAAARAHSVDMAQNHFVAHNSPRSGTPSDRLHRASLQSGTVLENLGRGYGAREIHEGLMASPGHRANLLNERVTHIGIGAAAEPGATGGVVVTEDFIEVAGAVDTAAAPASLLERLNSARTRRGASAVALRPQLVEVAGATARAFFENPRDSQQVVVDRANRSISRFGLIFRRVAVLATVVTRIDDAAQLEPLFDPAIASVGIGVAQGSRPDTPPNAVFVVFVIGYPR
ncbi:MAG: CAP domain-containing protein, partial [Deltaproteobacteria bacterium]